MSPALFLFLFFKHYYLQKSMENGLWSLLFTPIVVDCLYVEEYENFSVQTELWIDKVTKKEMTMVWCLNRSSLVRKLIWPDDVKTVKTWVVWWQNRIMADILWAKMRSEASENDIVFGIWGFLGFCLTSHQLSASNQFHCVEISLLRSLNHQTLIILS